MNQIQHINLVRVLERRLTIENEKLKNMRISSYEEALDELRRLTEDSENKFGRSGRTKEKDRPVHHPYPQESCLKSQHG